MEIDRPPGVFDVAQETADARGRPLVDLAFDRNPAITAWTARIGRALGIVNDQPRSKSGLYGRRFGAQPAVNQQQSCEEEKAEHHETGTIGRSAEARRNRKLVNARQTGNPGNSARLA